MKGQQTNKIKLGIFVLSAVALLLLGLFYIGNNKNIFHSNINVSANFKNVGGLMTGNNVRFNGINVGTISKVYAIADTLIKVEFTIDEVSMKYIDQNSIASVGNDGLLGNKIINISPIGIPSQPVQEGSVLKSTNPVEMEHIMRTLMDSNNNLKSITDNLKDVSFKLNSDNSLWRLVNDEQMANNVRFSASNLNRMSNQALSITGDLLSISKGIKQGKGSIGKLINDTMLVTRINNTMGKFERISDTVTMMSKDMAHVVTRIKQGEGTVGKLLKDTLIVYNLNRTLISVDTGISRFNENMKAVQYSWPFKKYYKKIKPKQ